MSRSLFVRLISALFFISTLCSCSSAEYLVVTPATFNTANKKPIPKKLILFESDGPTKQMEGFAKLLNKKSWAQIESKINTLESGQQRLFVEAVMYLMAKHYVAAEKMLTNLQESDFDCQIELLKTDILYRSRPRNVDFQDRYQHVFDCSDNPLVKTIVRDRYRLVRYEN